MGKVETAGSKGAGTGQTTGCQGEGAAFGRTQFPKCRKAYLTQLRAERLVALWAEAEGVKWKRLTGSLDPVPGVPQEEVAGGWEEEEPVVHPKARPGRQGAPALRDRAAAGGWSSACSPVRGKGLNQKTHEKSAEGPSSRTPHCRPRHPHHLWAQWLWKLLQSSLSGPPEAPGDLRRRGRKPLARPPSLEVRFPPRRQSGAVVSEPERWVGGGRWSPLCFVRGPLPRLPLNAVTRESGLTD